MEEISEHKRERERLWREMQKEVIYDVSRYDGYSWLSAISEVNCNSEMEGMLVI